jgi:2-polyprenyl-6-methoxyphenol hydroxylase-like FAD-dependent oxidoreductase
MGHAIVVGAGPAGALVALLLARRGARATLLERQTDFAREFRGEILMPSGIDALVQAGLSAQFAALPRLAVDTVDFFRANIKLATVALATLPDRPQVVPQSPMLEMIVAEAARAGGFALERGVTVRDLIMENGRAAGVRADTVHGPREFRGDFVIATDGRTSVVRKRLAPAIERIQQAFDVVWCRVHGQFLDGSTARFYFARGHLFIIYPSPEGHLQFGWIIKKGTFADIRTMGAEGWLDAMAPYISADLREFIGRNRDALRHPVLLDVICDRLRDWTAPGVLMIGDASHPMSPVGGQGINIALRDAVVAANHLGRALANDADAIALDGAARRVQAERSPEVTTIQDLQQLGPRILFGEGIASRVLTSAPAMRFVARFLAPFLVRRARPFLYGTTPVRLEN